MLPSDNSLAAATLDAPIKGPSICQVHGTTINKVRPARCFWPDASLIGGPVSASGNYPPLVRIGGIAPLTTGLSSGNSFLFSSKAANMYRLIFGALAGITATTAMTCFMRLAFDRLPPEHRYPLPPKELTDIMEPTGEKSHGNNDDLTVVAHFAYGSLAGALYPLASKTRAGGCLYGILVWCISYLGWIPAMRLLRPATQHPRERNLLMIGAHLIWGAALQLSYRELCKATSNQFSSGNSKDKIGT